MELKESVPPVSISAFLPIPEGKDQYTSAFIETHLAVVLKNTEQYVTVGMCDTDNTALKEILSHFHDKRIEYRKLDHDDLSEYLGKLHSRPDGSHYSPAFSGEEKLLLDKIANDAPVINFVNSTIIEAIRKRASDIHIEAFTDTVQVRYRIDGVLSTHNTIEPSLFPAVSSRLKIMANLNIMERRRPQGGRTSVHLGNDTQDIRVSIIPTVRGESIVLRLLNRKSTLPGLESLGLKEESLVKMRKIVKASSGLVLVTGPTGSGKTTTLNSLLREMDREHKKIITVEDPVEYIIEGIDQVQTHEAVGITFNSILKRILRQDPDVIMIGEIRDIETANLAVRAALTGHLVLSTLHTNDSVSVIDRLTNMGVQPFMTAAVLKTAMAQRLVRKICTACGKKRAVSPTERELFKKAGKSPHSIYEAAGCEQCGGTGYRGRTLIHEYFFIGEEIEKLIASGARHLEIKKYLEKKGTLFLHDDGLEKVIKGITTLEEIEAVTSSS